MCVCVHNFLKRLGFGIILDCKNKDALLMLCSSTGDNERRGILIRMKDSFLQLPMADKMLPR